MKFYYFKLFFSLAEGWLFLLSFFLPKSGGVACDIVPVVFLAPCFLFWGGGRFSRVQALPVFSVRADSLPLYI